MKQRPLPDTSGSTGRRKAARSNVPCRGRHSRMLLVAATTACVALLATMVALRGEASRDPSAPARHFNGHPVQGANLHASLGNAPGGSSRSFTPPETGWMPGARLVTYSEGGRDARRVRGVGRGRMVYTGTGSWEPTLGIDSKGNIFFQGTSFSTETNLVMSRDAGRSWHEVTPTTHTHTMDPMIYVDKTTDRVFTTDLTWPCITVSHSDDLGKSWTTSEACGLADHQNLFTGPPVSSSTVGYPNIVYMCAIDGGAGNPPSTTTSCLKSLDGGITWVRTATSPYTSGDPGHEDGTGGVPGLCEGGTGHGFVDSKGVVYLPRGWCGQPYLAISHDEGATWERIQVATNGMGINENGIPGSTRIFEHEAAVAVDAKGNIYYFWTARNRLPYLAISRDGGKSFSSPMRVGPPGLKEAWGPTMDIGATGKIALAYLGSTNAPGGEAPDGMGEEYTDDVTWNGYITSTVNALSKKPRFLTASVNRPSDPVVRGECGVECSVQKDFIDVVVGPDGRPYTSMVDECAPPGDECDDFLGFVGTVVRGPKLH